MAAGVHAGQDEGYRFIRSITVSNLDEPVTVPEGYFWKVQGLEADRPEGIGTADLYLDGEISLGNPMVDEDWVTIQGRLELTIQRRQEAAIWIRGSSVVAVGDSRQDVEFLEFTYSSAGGPGTAKLTSMVDLVDYVGTYPCSTGLLKESVLRRALERALGGDYGAYREHMQASGCGAIERKEGLLLMDVSQSGVGGYSSLIFVRLGDGAMYVFWFRGIVSDRNWKIYGSPPIPVAVMKTVVDQMNTKWGHVASFRARDAKTGKRLWKLPEPWTPRTRPPLLGKRPERVFHSYHRPCHREPKCYPCSRLTLLPMFPVAHHGFSERSVAGGSVFPMSATTFQLPAPCFLHTVRYFPVVTDGTPSGPGERLS